MAINSIGDVHDFLDQIPMFKDQGSRAARFTLDGIKKICAVTGNPQNVTPSIHVAGTNGKGTTCHMLASVMQEAGYTTGLYTSPHLFKVHERFKINGVEANDDSLIEFFDAYSEAIIQLQLTYFEITTAFAFWYFAKEKVDIMIIETGLGGRLDSTNILNPLVSVITSIGLDHTDVLGSTIAQITTEKAGIIKKNIPVVIGNLPVESIEIIQNKCDEVHTTFHLADALTPTFLNGFVELHGLKLQNTQKIKLGLPNPVNAINVAMTVKSIQLLPPKFNISWGKLKAGLENTVRNTGLYGRFERLHPTEEWYFDGAHNAQAMEHTVETIRLMNIKKPHILVFNVMKDKLTADFKYSISHFDELYYFETNNNRAACYHEVSTRVPLVTLFQAKSFSPRFKSKLVIFSGSFYFYATIKGLSKNWI